MDVAPSTSLLSLGGLLCGGLCLFFLVSSLGLAVILVSRSRKNRPEDGTP